MGMVVRSNIMAQNANRQLGMNNSSVTKNLEKLSSGFKINRAGDDASGLAISEKMKAQIKGLDTASANAQDGISLVQTAEGALTEVHDMLNRMVEISEKSANGTMEAPENPAYGAGGTDRNALQEEMDALATEIDRISQSTNFNGIKLLDGSLAGAAAAAGAKAAGAPATAKNTAVATGAIKGTDNLGLTGGTFTFKAGITDDQKDALNTALAGGKDITFTYGKVGGGTNTLAATDTLKIDATAITGYKFFVTDSSSAAYELDGTNLLTHATSGKVAGTADLTGGLAITIKTAAGDEIGTFTLGHGIADSATLTDAAVSTVTLKSGEPAGTAFKKGDSFTYDFTSGKNFDANNTITIGGKTLTAKANGATGAEFNIGTTVDETIANIKTLLADTTNGVGTTFDVTADATGKKIILTAKADSAANATAPGAAVIVGGKTGWDTAPTKTPAAGGGNAGGGLSLQIGDTNDTFNQLAVSITATDMATLFGAGTAAVTHTVGDTVGTTTLDISTQANARTNMGVIKTAINTVSTTRAKLGATQNRLEHTINNLDVASENMTAANSRVRDTDMAKQMMEYTKMNVLTQAAQAMLAQANQQPQSILQLLQ